MPRRNRVGKTRREGRPLKTTKRLVNEEKKRSCGSKKKYDDSKHAETHAAYLRMSDGRHSSAYLCKFCGFWHAGHTPFNKMIEEGVAHG